VALATAGGVLAMAVIVFAGAMISSLVHPTHNVTAAGPVLSTTAVTTTDPTPTPSTAAAPTPYQPSATLGPYGLGTLKLGMSWKDAVSGGELRQSTAVAAAGCLRYTVFVEPLKKPTIEPVSPATTADVAGAAGVPQSLPPDPATVADVVVSVRDGIVEVIGGPLLRTPEGIGVGSTKDALADAYPKLIVPTRGGSTTVEVLANPEAVYMFDVSGAGTVTSFSLRMAKSDCLG
jgi:hypothetical protein